MKNHFYLLLLLLLTSCFPNFNEGPEPHSIEFNKGAMHDISAMLKELPKLKQFSVETPPETLSKQVLEQMKAAEIKQYQAFTNDLQLFICGTGTLDQGFWGFAKGHLPSASTPLLLTNSTQILELNFVKKVDEEWYRISGNTSVKP